MKPLRNTADLRNIHLPVLHLLLVLGLATLPACQTAHKTVNSNTQAAARTPFVSDGCSCVPDGPPSDPQRWHSACTEHDRSYWRGGTRRQRLIADRQLKAEIEHSGNPLISKIYFLGIRLGGSPYFPAPWRWGFGRPWPSGYTRAGSSNSTQVLP